MAIVNPNTGRTANLLKQIIAEREEARLAGSPSAQAGAPLRQVVQTPQLQPESPGSARVAAAKPELAGEAPAVAPPSGAVETPGFAPAAPAGPAPQVVGFPKSAPGVGPSAPATAPSAPGQVSIAAPQPPSPAVKGVSAAILPTRIAPKRQLPQSRVTPRYIITPMNKTEPGKVYPKPTPFPMGESG